MLSERETVAINIDDLSRLDGSLANRGKHVHVNIKIPSSFVIEGLRIDRGLDELVSRLRRKNITFKLLPIPPCLLDETRGGDFTESRKPSFHMDEGFVYYSSPESLNHMKGLKTLETCVKCDMLNRECSGIKYSSRHTRDVTEIKEWVNEFLEKGVRVLDLGCGPSSVVLKFGNNQKEMPTTCCLDPYYYNLRILTKNANKYCRQHSKNLIPLVGMGENLPLKNDVFDVVVLKSTYDHLFDLQKTLLGIRRVLKPDGRVYILEEYYENRTPYETANKLRMNELMELIIKQTEFRNHTLKEAVSKVKEHFDITEKFEKKEDFGSLWGIKGKVIK
jgi:ubiquinone/menaquinone biosynthesis C-methylase UbiE